MMVQATMAVYKAAVATFLPTPSKSHYVFNLRDFSRVVSGVLLVPKTHMTEPNKLVRLWVHEVYRVFYDRLIADDDRQQFFAIVHDTLSQQFKIATEKLLGHLAQEGKTVVDDDIRSLFFGDYMIPGADPKIYNEVQDFTELTSIIEKWVNQFSFSLYLSLSLCSYLDEYNQMSKAPMKLVMFKFAIEHVSRISRVLKQDNGHCLLIGICSVYFLVNLTVNSWCRCWW